MLKHFGKTELELAFLITLVACGIIAYKVYVLEYSMTTIEPEDGYYIQLLMTVTGSGHPCDVRVTLPLESERQTIKYERQSSEGAFEYTISPNRIGRWRTAALSGENTITYTFFVRAYARKYPLPQSEPIPKDYPEGLRRDLKATDRIQVDAPEIRAKAQELAPEGVDLQNALQSIYNYCYSDVRFLKVRGPTDAMTALKLGEASCNGKNRLMVALLRARGIPARMANGLILERNRKRTTHAWTEAWIGDTWVPFCPTNGYFAEIPEDYLELAKGDVAVFTHTPHIGFDWNFSIRHQLSHRQEAILENAGNPLNILHTWTSLKEYHISIELLAIILMVPLGATIVAFSRNVLGLLPYGTFMPALIAVAFRDTGLWLGAGFFIAIIIICTVANLAMRRLRLLHIPRLAIIITMVVMCILFLPVAWLRMGLSASAAGVSFFPMAILSLTGERFTQTALEESWKEGVKRMIVTFLVATACYLVYHIEKLQILIVAFPELLLCNIALNLVIGSWTGVRLMEYYRFREVFRNQEGAPRGR